jgi:hypothetical protein
MLRPRRHLSLALALATLVVCAAWPRAAGAQPLTIRHPGERDATRVELEPNFQLGVITPPGVATGVGIGTGLRASFEIVRNGFIPTVNNSIAIGGGIDYVHYAGSGVVTPGTCTRFARGAAGTLVCVEVSQVGGPSNYLYFPVVMQWNFWITRQWSVFGEPGLALYWFDARTVGVIPTLYLGGRFRINNHISITTRLGYPTFSAGLSIFF